MMSSVFRLMVTPMLVLALLSSSCGGSGNSEKVTERDLYVVNGASGWTSEWWVNGEPVFVGWGQYGKDISKFVGDGENLIRLKASPLRENVGSEPEFRLVRSKSLFKQGELLHAFSREGDDYVPFSMNLLSGRSVMWRDGEVLSDIPQAELSAVANYALSCVAGGADERRDVNLVEWDAGAEGFGELLLVDAQVAPMDSYCLRVGSKLCLVWSDRGALLRGSVEMEGGGKMNVFVEFLYIYKKGGVWFVLFA
ncbi:hypothetical protein [Sulfuriroseicoccus oceanibius]|uniref:Uncharacterized protein n=1 Tax=Sulfuriroseicoccus oceanibius TaxID=2707525 RepID=A0A6B3LE65_9BACT|nr:hypothetical protein [Sulfuriroseicoccus oceanibius]QQL46018.1 hypothetical protein G3M56_005410 [Sulfuriroseicoccus oceanibius]